MRNFTANISKYVRFGLAAALCLYIAIYPLTTPRAQRVSESPVKVISVSSYASGANTVVSIAADSPLTRAQTWQDDYFHIVVYKGQSALKGGLPRGIKLQRVGDSLEIAFPINQGANVTVQPHFNRLNLVISGGARDVQNMAASNTLKQELYAEAERNWQPASGNSEPLTQGKRHPAPTATASEVASQSKSTPEPVPLMPQVASSNEVAPTITLQAATTPYDGMGPAAAQWAQANSSDTSYPNSDAQPSIPAPSESSVTTLPAASQDVAITQESSIVSPMKLVLLLLVCGLLALFFKYPRQRSGVKKEVQSTTALVPTAKAPVAVHTASAKNSSQVERRQGERRKGDRRASDQSVIPPQATSAPSSGAEKEERKQDVRPVAAAGPTMLFNPYEISQEVEKLVQGQPHRIDVLASRAREDRRAIETSLIKVLHASESSEDERRRARMALEDYGFVARQNAALLLAPDTYERTSAARVLGKIMSPTSLPFLLEALYDTEMVVRTEAVASLGALRLPSAIGALLDIARRYPDIPVSVLGRALSACSVESLELPSNPAMESHSSSTNAGEVFTGEITALEPVEAVEQLPEWLEDETLADALERLESVDVEARIAAAQSLGRFQVRRSVEALSAMSTHDAEPAVRAAAVSSLSAIDHESGFAAVLMALGDESREVCAAAARALSRLSFDRADAYVRVAETSNNEMLRNVAHACVKSGMVAQAVERLASEDRRQAYEAFSLLSLIAKAGETAPLLHIVENHSNVNVRVIAVRLLGQAGRRELTPRLRNLANRPEVPEKVRATALEVLRSTDRVLVE